MRPKQQRGEATVEQVLVAALRIYASEGEAGLTVGAITKASGVSSGSIYHHFGNLHGVIATLALRSVGRLLDALTTALEQATDARSGVRAVVRTYLDFAQAHPEVARLMHSVTADHELMTRTGQIRESQEARLTPIALWIHAHTKSGELADLPTPVIEALVLGPVVAVVRRWLTVGDIDLAEADRTLPDQIWRAVSNVRTGSPDTGPS
ncbi:TetR/AcrR family transcriptional regulator [Streptomyces sp. NPDC006971]|uniref:TetR/AcrR family transcriptional regulator n=1 Tax=Streptomyces sp. NPDC006971 TaxID=3154784 RepID=UPI0033DD27BA